MVACAQAGADAVDAASDSMSGMTSQPSIGAILASLEGTEHDPGLNGHNVRALDTYWAQLRLLYSPFEAGLTGPDPGKLCFLRYFNLCFATCTLFKHPFVLPHEGQPRP